MKQQVDFYVKLTTEIDIKHNIDQIRKCVAPYISGVCDASFSKIITCPSEIVAIREEAEIYGNDESKMPIVITVKGGVVQNVEHIPSGVIVEVQDWDDEENKTANVATYYGPIENSRKAEIEKALRTIANIVLAGEPIPVDHPLHDAAWESGQYMDGEYNPTNDTEHDTLTEVVEIARCTINLLDRNNKEVSDATH